ncbi:MAG: hypothetical protein KDB88_08360 [Flavobacteriales bacterium]|nr:hypothetical protein [Flavobacteriales bacterium]
MQAVYQGRLFRVLHPMTRSRTLYLLCSCMALVLNAQAQVSELGITGGVTYYIGDLNPYRHYPKYTSPAGGLFYRYNFGNRYALRVQGLYGRLEAYDRNSPDTLQQIRNLHFRSSLFEGSALVEVNFFKYRSTDKDSKKWTPFLFVGLAYFRTNPRTRLNDTWYDLQPLGTEGQGAGENASKDPYRLDQVSIPFGAGLKANLGRIDIQLEWGLRRTYTDYIDDVSGRYADPAILNPLAAELADRSEVDDPEDRTGTARGDSQTRDWYQYTGLSISVLLTKFTECDALYFRRRR